MCCVTARLGSYRRVMRLSGGFRVARQPVRRYQVELDPLTFGCYDSLPIAFTELNCRQMFTLAAVAMFSAMAAHFTRAFFTKEHQLGLLTPPPNKS